MLLFDNLFTLPSLPILKLTGVKIFSAFISRHFISQLVPSIYFLRGSLKSRPAHSVFDLAFGCRHWILEFEICIKSKVSVLNFTQIFNRFDILILFSKTQLIRNHNQSFKFWQSKSFKFQFLQNLTATQKSNAITVRHFFCLLNSKHRARLICSRI